MSELDLTNEAEISDDVSEGVSEDYLVCEVADAMETGKIEHYDFRANILENDTRAEGLDTFTCEKAITDSDGNVVHDDEGHFGKPDFVDYDNNVIVDLKPIHDDETEEDVYDLYQDQLQGYCDLYREGRGVEPELQLAFYDADAPIAEIPNEQDIDNGSVI